MVVVESLRTRDGQYLRQLMKRALLFLVAALSPIWAAAAVPEVLIFQVLTPKSRGIDPNVGMLPYIAQEFDDDGRVVPITWSMTDPLFRAAVSDGHIKYTENPSFEALTDVAKRLKIEYVFLIQAWQKGASVRTRVKLFQGDKLVWQDPDVDKKVIESQIKTNESAAKFAASNGLPMPTADIEDLESRSVMLSAGAGFDADNFGKSVAHTWAALMFQTPFKNLKPRPRMGSVPVDPGLTAQPNVEITPPPPPPVKKVDNKDLMESVMKLLTAGQAFQAVQLLRDSVDAEPMDVERRRALINALMQTGQVQLAATEARRAAELMPEQIEFRAQAARAWLQLGKPEEASKDLNEAVARDPESPATRALIGEMNLLKGQYAASLEQFDFVISKAPSPEAHFRRALARTLNNDAKGSEEDLEAAKKLGLAGDVLSIRSRYASAASLTDSVMVETGNEVRSLLQRALVKPKDAEVIAEQLRLSQRSAALSSLYERLSVPEVHKGSHERRLLALKLLLQSLTEIGSYLKNQDEVVIGDATINLGEALRQVKAAQEAYKAELDKG